MVGRTNENIKLDLVLCQIIMLDYMAGQTCADSAAIGSYPQSGVSLLSWLKSAHTSSGTCALAAGVGRACWRRQRCRHSGCTRGADGYLTGRRCL